jgi:hypothetical protein
MVFCFFAGIVGVAEGSLVPILKKLKVCLFLSIYQFEKLKLSSNDDNRPKVSKKAMIPVQGIYEKILKS